MDRDLAGMQSSSRASGIVCGAKGRLEYPRGTDTSLIRSSTVLERALIDFAAESLLLTTVWLFDRPCTASSNGISCPVDMWH